MSYVEYRSMPEIEKIYSMQNLRVTTTTYEKIRSWMENHD